MDNPDWIPVMDSLREPLAQLRRFASLRAYHDRGQFDEAETHNNSRLVGRSVWNTRWLLIIPGRTLLADPDEGIERFVHGALVNAPATATASRTSRSSSRPTRSVATKGDDDATSYEPRSCARESVGEPLRITPAGR